MNNCFNSPKGKLIHFIFLAATLFYSSLQAQEQDSVPKNWELGLGLGLEIVQLLQINPKVGAGENKFGLGWAISSSANYKKERVEWDNSFDWNFSIQKLGSGTFLNGEEKTPFQKSIDELRMGSKLGFKFSGDSKFYYAFDFSFLSQMTKTYRGNYLMDILEPDIDNHPISRLLSPAQINFSIGIDYKPDNYLSIFYSPLGYKAIVVADNDIADDVVRNKQGEITGSVHGNPIKTDPSKMILLSFSNTLHNLGSLLRASYKRKFLKKRLSLKTGLSLYSNYLENPERVDVEWTTETGFNIIEGLNLSLFTTLFYDYDVFAFRTNYDLPDGVEPVPERNLWSFTQQFLLKYNISF